jgi:hypothetical protein
VITLPKVSLVDDWRQMGRWYTTWINATGITLSAIAVSFSYASSAFAMLPVFPFRAVCLAFGIIFLCSFIGRLISQKKEPDNGDSSA